MSNRDNTMDRMSALNTWNAEKDFLEKYRDWMGRVKSGDHEAYYLVKELRTKVFRNTVELATRGSYVTELSLIHI